MAKEWAKAFYKTKQWIKCRNAYIAERTMIDGGMCEECGKNLGYILHHKIVLTKENINNPDVSLNHDNLEYVCKDCHDKFDGHGVGKEIKPLCVFDAEGNPISMREIDSPHFKSAYKNIPEPMGKIDLTHKSS